MKRPDWGEREGRSPEERYRGARNNLLLLIVFTAINLLMPLLWENPCGMLETDGMYSIVTSGVGVWGPNMRILTDSEIVVINITFTGQA